MRTRFFLVILAVLTLVSASSVIIHALILRNEKIKLLDEQVREAAATILDSEIVELRRVDYETVEKILSEELGESRIGKFFVIRNQEGSVVYKSPNAALFDIGRIPQGPQWVTLRLNEKYMRVLNLKLPKIMDRTLQVGVIVDSVLLDFTGITRRSATFFLLMFFAGLLAAWFLTSTFLAPLKELEHYVSRVALQVTRMKSLSKMPDKLKRSLDREGRDSQDEYFRLLRGIEVLIERMSRSYRSSRVWGYQMAHEIKTPLSILKIEIERASTAKHLSAAETENMQRELDRTSETVSAFLEWAEMETTDQRAPLHVKRISESLEDLCKRFERQDPGRIHIDSKDDFVVVCNPQHLEQALVNLVGNSLKYSPSDAPVKLSLAKRRLVIEDWGLGIPGSVIDRLGEPFNRGDRDSSGRGHGLGLAWVASVASLYSWSLGFERKEGVTRVILDFGPEEFQASSEGGASRTST